MTPVQAPPTTGKRKLDDREDDQSEVKAATSSAAEPGSQPNRDEVLQSAKKQATEPGSHTIDLTSTPHANARNPTAEPKQSQQHETSKQAQETGAMQVEMPSESGAEAGQQASSDVAAQAEKTDPANNSQQQPAVQTGITTALEDRGKLLEDMKAQVEEILPALELELLLPNNLTEKLNTIDGGSSGVAPEALDNAEVCYHADA